MTVPKLRFPEFWDAREWEEKELQELGKLVSGLTYSPDDIGDAGLLVLRSSNIQNGTISLDDNVFVTPDIKGANLSQSNDILICVRNGSKALIGKNALIPEDMPLCTHDAFMTVFRTKAWKFVYQLFQTDAYQKQVDGDLGATINSINGRQFLKYKFFVPSPKEQQQITDCLSSLDELIAAQSQKLDALKAHKKGLMQQLFPAEGETRPQLRFPEFQGAGEWEEKKLGEIISQMQSGLSRLLSDNDIGLPVIRSNNIQDGKLDISDVKYWYKNDNQGANTTSYYLKDGDLLVNFINSIAQIGKVAIYKNILDRDVIFTTNIMRLKIKEEINNNFIYFFCQTVEYDRHIQAITKPAINQASFTTKDFCKLIIKTPLFPEQTKIADCLTSIDDQITAQSQKLDRLKAHKKGLIQQLFPALDEVKK